MYLSSGMHCQGNASLRDLTWQQRPRNTTQAYCDPKLHDLSTASRMVDLLDPGLVAAQRHDFKGNPDVIKRRRKNIPHWPGHRVGGRDEPAVHGEPVYALAEYGRRPRAKRES